VDPQHHDLAGPAGLVSSVGLASVAWVGNLEVVLRISASILTILVACCTLFHYYNVYFRKKK